MATETQSTEIDIRQIVLEYGDPDAEVVEYEFSNGREFVRKPSETYSDQ